MPVSTYEIVAKFVGEATAIASIKRIQAAEKTGITQLATARKQAGAAVQRDMRIEQQVARDMARDKALAFDRELQGAQRVARESSRIAQQYRQKELAAVRLHQQKIKEEIEHAQKRSGLSGAGFHMPSGKHMMEAGLGLFAGEALGVGEGLKMAAEFESSMTRIRIAVAHGADAALDGEKVNAYMERFQSETFRLSETWPKSADQIAQAFLVLKQGAMDTDVILGGAGEAVVRLAVLLGQTPAEVAEPFAQMARLFRLSGADMGRATDQLNAMKQHLGITPESFMSGAQLFYPKIMATLGQTGIGAMETTSDLMLLLKSSGLSEQKGMQQLTMLMSKVGMIGKKGAGAKMLALLRGKGIEMSPFDKKGQFVGFERFIGEFGKLDKLSPQLQTQAIAALFGGGGARGGGGVAAEFKMIEKMFGPKALADIKQYHREVNDSTEDAKRLAEELEGRWERFSNTMHNLVTKAFLPLAESLEPVVDKMGTIGASVGNFLTAHTTVVKLTAGIVGLGGVIMTLVGAWKMAAGAVTLYRLRQQLAMAEGSFATLFSGGAAGVGGAAARQASFNAAYGAELGTGAAAAGTTAGIGFAGAFGLAAAAAGLGYLIYTMASEGREEAAVAGQELGGILAKELITKLRKDIPEGTKQAIEDAARPEKINTALEALGIKKEPSTIPLLGWAYGAGPMKAAQFGESFPAYKEDLIKEFRGLGLTTGDVPGFKGTFAERTEKYYGGPRPDIMANLEEVLKQAVPGYEWEQQKAAQEQASQATSEAARQLNLMSVGAESAYQVLNSFKSLNLGVPHLPGATGPLLPGSFGAHAAGGIVRQEGLGYIHRGEVIVPAHVTERFRSSDLGGLGRSVNINLHAPVTIHGAVDGQGVQAVQRAIERAIPTLKREILAILDDHAADRALGA
jgi:TP901 family phage tail tape measure protein